MPVNLSLYGFPYLITYKVPLNRTMNDDRFRYNDGRYQADLSSDHNFVDIKPTLICDPIS